MRNWECILVSNSIGHNRRWKQSNVMFIKKTSLIGIARFGQRFEPRTITVQTITQGSQIVLKIWVWYWPVTTSSLCQELYTEKNTNILFLKHCYFIPNDSECTEKSSRQEKEPHDWHLDVLLYHVTLVRIRLSTPKRPADRKRNPMTVTLMCLCIMLPWWEPEWVHRREQQTGRGTPWLSPWCVPVSCYLSENQSEYTEESSRQEEEPHDCHLDLSL